MPTIGQKIDILRAAYPRALSGGFLYRDDVDLRRKFRSVVVWMLLTDDDGRFAVRSIEFRRTSPADFRIWQMELSEPHQSTRIDPKTGKRSNELAQPRFQYAREKVLERMGHRHQGAWRLDRIIGWAGGKDAIRNSDNTAPRRAGSRAKQSRGQHE